VKIFCLIFYAFPNVQAGLQVSFEKVILDL